MKVQVWYSAPHGRRGITPSVRPAIAKASITPFGDQPTHCKASHSPLRCSKAVRSATTTVAKDRYAEWRHAALTDWFDHQKNNCNKKQQTEATAKPPNKELTNEIAHSIPTPICIGANKYHGLYN